MAVLALGTKQPGGLRNPLPCLGGRAGESGAVDSKLPGGLSSTLAHLDGLTERNTTLQLRDCLSGAAGACKTTPPQIIGASILEEPGTSRGRRRRNGDKDLGLRLRFLAFFSTRGGACGKGQLG